MSKDNKNQKLESKTKDEAINLLKAACLRNKKKKHHTDSSKSDYFSMEDVDQFLSQQATKKPILEKETAKTEQLKRQSMAIGQESTAADLLESKEKRVLKAASISDILGFNPAQAPTKDSDSSAYDLHEASKVPSHLKDYYQALIQLRNQLKEEIVYLAKSSLQDPAGDVARYTSDQSSDHFEQEIAMGLVTNEKETLKEVEAAIKRIFNGTYGICEITGKAIPKKRLDSIPYARYTIEGQEQVEEMKKNHRTHKTTSSVRSPDEETSLSDRYYSEDLVENEEV